MKTAIHIQLPSGKKRDTLDRTIEKLSYHKKWQQISVAVAYSSLAGVARLDEVVRAANPNASFRWLLGLDDYITHPAAIEFCQEGKNSEVRVYASRNPIARFHPKVVLFESELGEGSSSMTIGSANLTYAALNRNCEAISILDAQSQDDRVTMRSRFESLWRLGRIPTPHLISEYKDKFDALRASRGFLLSSERDRKAKLGPVFQSDVAIINPGSATVCWIEVGKNTAKGRELEVKGEQARFFGLEPTGGTPEWREFRVSNGTVVRMRLKYRRSNSMWRLQLNVNVPEVAYGLRPLVDGRLARSPYVAVFERIPGSPVFCLSFLREDAPRFEGIRRLSEKSGTVGSTLARRYGWH
ncbi:MAG: phospholipase D-like domain-containing protein [Verrucomicrobiota bacterium]|jgi:HKD family nuclease